MTRTLIAGCGDVGTRLGLSLAAEGHEVFGLRRNVAALPAAIVPVAADLRDPTSLAALPHAPEIVVYAASADERTEAAYRAAYVDGVTNLLEALARAGARPRRVLLVSTTGVYAQSDGAFVDETSPTEPDSPFGALPLEGERRLLDSGLPATVLRCAGLYGPGRTRLLAAVRQGRASVPDEVPYTNRIHVDDAAGALRHLAELADPAPVYLGVDHDPAPLDEVLAWLAARLEVPSPTAAGDGGAGSQERRGRNKRCRNDRLVASGYRFRYPTFREGYAALIDAETQH